MLICSGGGGRELGGSLKSWSGCLVLRTKRPRRTEVRTRRQLGMMLLFVGMFDDGAKLWGLGGGRDDANGVMLTF